MKEREFLLRNGYQILDFFEPVVQAMMKRSIPVTWLFSCCLDPLLCHRYLCDKYPAFPLSTLLRNLDMCRVPYHMVSVQEIVFLKNKHEKCKINHVKTNPSYSHNSLSMFSVLCMFHLIVDYIADLKL